MFVVQPMQITLYHDVSMMKAPQEITSVWVKNSVLTARQAISPLIDFVVKD
jgi:hypothetical protein